MTPEDLAEMYPRLYHVTDFANWEGIQKHGLLSTSSILALHGMPDADRAIFERQRRPESKLLTHPEHGQAIINDNIPLIEKALIPYLDDGLAPADWYTMLNRRVFFWVTMKDAMKFLQAKAHEGQERMVLVLDTLSVAKQYAEQIEMSPINSGSAVRRPPRRGLSTFTPMLKCDYPSWRRQRGNISPDRIVELTVVRGVDVIADHLIERYLRSGSGIRTERWSATPN